MWNDLSGQVLIKYLLSTFNIQGPVSGRETQQGDSFSRSSLSSGKWNASQMLSGRPGGRFSNFLDLAAKLIGTGLTLVFVRGPQRVRGRRLGLPHYCIYVSGLCAIQGMSHHGLCKPILLRSPQSNLKCEKQLQALSLDLSSGYLSPVLFSPSPSLFFLSLSLSLSVSLLFKEPSQISLIFSSSVLLNPQSLPASESWVSHSRLSCFLLNGMSPFSRPVMV